MCFILNGFLQAHKKSRQNRSLSVKCSFPCGMAIINNNIPRGLRTRESIDLTASWAETETSSSEGGKRLINGKSRKFEDGIEIARKKCATAGGCVASAPVSRLLSETMWRRQVANQPPEGHVTSGSLYPEGQDGVLGFTGFSPQYPGLYPNLLSLVLVHSASSAPVVLSCRWDVQTESFRASKIDFDSVVPEVMKLPRTNHRR